ncbi:MAG: ribosome maturation factor RimP [Cetobacterium sp.]|uniref:ribosome maturation factor RimP n=1 Tax=unclassified Cetobacterium TaxID=2630983 RepID=UPI0006480E0C|nr:MULTISPECIES: ribosome maturation factor RimP [unclassified Cetobacterium]
MEETLIKIEKVVIPAVEKRNVELVDLEYIQEGGYLYVRIFIEKTDGDITLEDCGSLSNDIDETIDALIPHKFFLEVSSPGVERPLKKEADFIRFNGEKIKVSLKHKLNDNKNFEGIIEDFKNETLFLNIKGQTLEIPFKEIKKANIVFDFSDI